MQIQGMLPFVRNCKLDSGNSIWGWPAGLSESTSPIHPEATTHGAGSSESNSSNPHPETTIQGHCQQHLHCQHALAWRTPIPGGNVSGNTFTWGK